MGMYAALCPFPGCTIMEVHLHKNGGITVYIVSIPRIGSVYDVLNLLNLSWRQDEV